MDAIQMLRKYVDFISMYLAINAVFSLLALILFYPFHPVTLAGSIVWFLTVLPIQMFGEWLGSIFFNQKVGKFINRNTSGISIGRIGYGVLAMIVLLILVGVFLYLLGGITEGFTPFFENNFSSDW